MANATPVARISAIEGKAFARNENGEMRPLRVGDLVYQGDVLVADHDSRVDLATPDGQSLVVHASETVTVDPEVLGAVMADATDSALHVDGKDASKVIQAINQGGSLDALLEETAAGEGAGGADGGPTFVRLLRISEGVDPQHFEFGTAQPAHVDDYPIAGQGGETLATQPAVSSNEPVVTLQPPEPTPTVQGVSSPSVTEGGDLVHTVTLSGAPSAPLTLTFSLNGDTASPSDFGTPTFSNGVALSGGVLTVPAGVSSFTVSYPTIDDALVEPTETVNLTVGGVTGVGSILDNDVLPPPTVESVTSESVTEGGTLVHTVTLSGAPSAPLTLTFGLNGDTASTDDFGTPPTFSNGVTLSGGVLTVPAGVSSFTVSYPTIDDALVEPTETVNLTVGGVTGVGSILDNDVLPVAPTLDLDHNNSHNTVSVQTIAGLFNTGVDANGNALAVGIHDPHYDLASKPSSSQASDLVATNDKWVANDADSAWIGYGSNSPSQTTGLYQFQTTFTLQAGADPKSVLIDMDVSSDNFLRDILVNGVSTGICSADSYAKWTHVQLSGGSATFHDGANTITFVVDNRDPGNPSPSTSGSVGLRVDNLTSRVAVIGSDMIDHQSDYAAIYVEGTPVAIADADIHLADADSTTLHGAVITLTNPQADDVLLTSGLPAGISVVPGGGGTVVTLTGEASLAAYEAAISAIRFDNTSQTPTATVDRTITVTVSDGALTSNVGTTTIHVVPVADAPTLDLDANNSTTGGSGYTRGYTEQQPGGVLITDSDVSIGDIDSATIKSATIHLTNAQPGDYLSMNPLPGGLTASQYDPATGTITISGDGSPASYQTALHSVVFRNQTDDPSTLSRVIEITVNDGSVNSNVATTTLNVTAVNDAPVNTVPTAALSATEDVSLTLTTLKVGDPDNATLTTTLSVDHGTLDVVNFAGATIANDNTGTVTISGSAAAINGALNGLVFKPAADYSGAAHLTVATTDGSLTDTDNVTINVAPAADAPTLYAHATSVDSQHATLHTEAILNDNDGSETLSSIVLSGIPADVTLTDAVTGGAITVSGGAASVLAGHDILMTSTSVLSDAVLNGITASVSASEVSSGATSPASTTVRVEHDAGTSAHDWIAGTAGNDVLNGGAGGDVLSGGHGNDVISGGDGADVLRWHLGETGTDTVHGFGTAVGTDVLDLRDLLVGEGHGSNADVGNLANYLHFSTSGGTTTVSINADANGAIEQTIVLQDVDLSLGGVLTTDQAIIHDLLNKGKLITD